MASTSTALPHHTTFDVTRRALTAGTTTCEAVTQEYLAAIERQKGLNAFLSVAGDRAIARAREVDRKLAEGRAGRLAAVPGPAGMDPARAVVESAGGVKLPRPRCSGAAQCAVPRSVDLGGGRMCGIAKAG